MAEGLALLRVGQGLLEGALGDAGGLRGDADAAAIERGESDLVAFAFGAEAICDRHFAIGETKFACRRWRGCRVFFLLCRLESRACRARRAAR